MNDNFEWTDAKISEFLNGVKTGRIKPKSCGNTQDSFGPLTSFSFPQYSCEIHVHWKNSTREEMSVAHFKDMRTQKRVIASVDTYTISMLRHFSGLDNKDRSDTNSANAKKGNTSISKILKLSLLAVLLMIIAIRLSNNQGSSNSEFKPFYGTAKSGTTIYKTCHSSDDAYHFSKSNDDDVIGRFESQENVQIMGIRSSEKLCLSFKIKRKNGQIGWVHQNLLIKDAKGIKKVSGY